MDQEQDEDGCDGGWSNCCWKRGREAPLLGDGF